MPVSDRGIPVLTSNPIIEHDRRAKMPADICREVNIRARLNVDIAGVNIRNLNVQHFQWRFRDSLEGLRKPFESSRQPEKVGEEQEPHGEPSNPCVPLDMPMFVCENLLGLNAFYLARCLKNQLFNKLWRVSESVFR